MSAQSYLDTPTVCAFAAKAKEVYLGDETTTVHRAVADALPSPGGLDTATFLAVCTEFSQAGGFCLPGWPGGAEARDYFPVLCNGTSGHPHPSLKLVEPSDLPSLVLLFLQLHVIDAVSQDPDVRAEDERRGCL